MPEHPSKRPLKIIGRVEDDAPTKRACITASNVLPLIPLSCQYPDLHPRFVHTLEKVRQRAYGFLDKDSTNSRSPSLKDRQRNVDIQLVFYADRLFGLRNMNRITNLLHTISGLYVTPLQSLTASAYDCPTSAEVFNDKSHIPDRAPSSGIRNANPTDAECLLLRQVQNAFSHATWAAIEEFQGTEDLAVLSRTLDMYLLLADSKGNNKSNLEIIKTELGLIAFYKDYMFLYNRVQLKKSSAQLLLEKFGYKPSKNYHWTGFLRNCFLRLVTGMKDLDNPTAGHHRQLVKYNMSLGCSLRLLSDSFGEGIFYMLPTDCRSQ